MKASAFDNFNESTQHVLDFARCQRADGSFYGTGGQCRKGSLAGAKEPNPSFRTRPKAAIEADMKKLASSGAMQEKGKAGRDARARFKDLKAEAKKPMLKDPVAGVAKQQKATKDFLKEDNKELAKNPELVKQTAAAKIRKLGNEYERLRGDNKAAARRKEIMDEVNKLVKIQTKANDQIEQNRRAAEGPKKPDTSLLAQQRRAAAVARTRD